MSIQKYMYMKFEDLHGVTEHSFSNIRHVNMCILTEDCVRFVEFVELFEPETVLNTFTVA